ncbi:hypothetical protein B566_EDAN013395 [Ephemera danica]|nr:hypothetical protein B566_EDAN013395 [Ephemera danica]
MIQDMADMEQIQPISRTYQYRKVMKPMLERKRRARINRCLDELKELMVSALQHEGENVNKLEKADILELTVRHLHRLRRQQRLSANPATDSDRYRAGFTHCAAEVSRCLATVPGVDVDLGTRLMTHLGHRLNDMEKTSPLTVRVDETLLHTPPSSPMQHTSLCASPEPQYYPLPLTPASSSACSLSPGSTQITSECGAIGLLKVVAPAGAADNVWRPW